MIGQELNLLFSSVAGLAYSNLVYDWVKAAVLFGVINTVSRLDRLDPPQPPKCITMLYVFSETYVYRPVRPSHFSTSFCFHKQSHLLFFSLIDTLTEE